MLEGNVEWIECSNVGNVLGSINVSLLPISYSSLAYGAQDTCPFHFCNEGSVSSLPGPSDC